MTRIELTENEYGLRVTEMDHLVPGREVHTTAKGRVCIADESIA